MPIAGHGIYLTFFFIIIIITQYYEIVMHLKLVSNWNKEAYFKLYYITTLLLEPIDLLFCIFFLSNLNF